MREEYFVTEETAGDRIDKFLAEQYENLSRSFLQKLLKSGEVMVDGRPVKASYKVAEGDLISFEVPEAVEPEIVPEEAAIVERIFEMFLAGQPVGLIAQTLQSENIEIPGKDLSFSKNMIMNILRNEKYCGDSILQKTVTVD